MLDFSLQVSFREGFLGKSSSLNLVSPSKENPTEASEGLPGLDGGSDSDEEAFGEFSCSH